MRMLADTNFVVGLMDEKDSLHRRALALNERLIESDAEIVYADCVINETIGVLLRRIREQRRTSELTRFLDLISELFPTDALTCTYDSVAEEWPAILEIIRETAGKLNFHDALLARSADKLSIDRIVSFDSDLDAYKKWTRVASPADI